MDRYPLTRRQFIEAVQAGMAKCADLNDEQRARLGNVAHNAVRADGNFSAADGKLNVGCPASQAALPRGHSDSPAWEFACAYDDFICALATDQRWFDGVVIS